MSPGRHGERVPVPFAASRCRAKPCIGSDLLWSEPELTPTGLRTVWLTIQSAFVRARKRRACATLPEPLARLFTRGERLHAPRSLDLLRDAPSRAPSAPVELFDSGAGSFDRAARPKRRIRPNSATHVIKDEHPCSAWLPLDWRARGSYRAASFVLQRQQSPLWPACPGAAGERSRLAHARIQGRPLTPRHLPRLIRTRSAGADSTRPIEIASTAATLNGSGFPDPRRLPSTRNRAGSSRSAPSVSGWLQRSRRSFTHCGFTAPG